MKLNLLIAALFLLFISCSRSIDDSVFVGKWFAVGATDWDYTQWTIDKDLVVIPTLLNLDNEYKFQLSKTENDIYTLTPEYGKEQHLGSIISLKTDTIKFSDGLSLVRLNKPTKTNYSITEFQELLKNSILEYSLDGMDTRLYVSDTLGNFGFNQLSLIRTGSLSTASLFEDWKASSLNKTFLLLYRINRTEIYSILIDGISDSSFTGSLYYFQNPVPISVTIKPSKSKLEKNSISEHLVSIHWLTTSTSVYDYSERFPDVIIEEAEQVIMEAIEEDLGITIKEEEIETNPFSFEFKKNGVFQIYKFGIPSYEMKWKIANDGDFVFIYNRFYDSGYINLEHLDHPSRKLRFELDINLDLGDNLISSKTLSFELTGN